jgi:regulation of enolase protein 1 (concanavalin A-like superfamily)
MLRHLCPLALIVLVCLAASAADPDPDPEPNPFMSGWDKPVDPDKDCKFKREKGGLTIELPGKPHNLSAELGRMNAPRLLRTVEGDFVAEVRVGGKFVPSAASTLRERPPYLGAGLLLITPDEKTYIRLDRAASRRDAVTTYASWELRRDGKWELPGTADVLLKEEGHTYLRLERKGDRILGAVSEDGKTWTEMKPLELKLPAKLKLGVRAGTTSTETFAPHFDRFKLRKGKAD